jgi:hypothetical protein
MAGIELKGTGGIIEGNLGAASVNVNLDSALLFDGVNDSIDCNDVSTLDGATDMLGIQIYYIFKSLMIVMLMGLVHLMMLHTMEYGHI